MIGLAIWTLYYWGNLGGALMLDGAPFSWDAFRTGALGLLVDRENGLLVWAPVYLLLPAAWAVAGRRYLAWLLPAAYLFGISAGHDQWWGGFSPAARFLMPLVPIFAAVAAVALRHPLFRYGSLMRSIPQIFISADGWQHAESLAAGRRPQSCSRISCGVGANEDGSRRCDVADAMRPAYLVSRRGSDQSGLVGGRAPSGEALVSPRDENTKTRNKAG